MVYYSQHGISSAEIGGAVAEALLHDLRVNGFGFAGFPQIFVPYQGDKKRPFTVLLIWKPSEEGSSSVVSFELTLPEAKAAVKRLKSGKGYDPTIFDRVQGAVAKLEGLASKPVLVPTKWN